MKYLRERPSYHLVYTMVAVAIIGIILSAILTTDNRWTVWHLSRLGEGKTLAAYVFNATLMLGALLMIWFSDSLITELKQLDRSRARRLTILWSLFVLIGVGWLGVAVFPFDQYPITHNIFGYGMFVMVCITMLGLRWFAPILPGYLQSASFGIIFIVSLAMLGFHIFHVGTLLLVELLGGILLFAWLIVLSRHTFHRLH